MSKKKKKDREATKQISTNRRILGVNARYRDAISVINDLQLELASRASLESISK